MFRKMLLTTLATLMLSVLLLPVLTSAKTAVPKHTGSFYVNDFANVIDEKAENYMVNYGIRLHQDSGAQVVLVTVDSTNGVSMEEYATSLFNSWGVGSADKNNGLLLLLSIKDDDYWAVQGKGIEDTLPNSKIKEILSQYLEPDFAAKTYSNGARKTYGAFIQAMGGTWVENVGSKNYVSDNAGVLKKVTKDYLNESSNRYKTTTGSGIYVVTVKNAGDKTLQDYTYMKFASVAAGPKDVMLVLDIGGDNYHVLQGKDIDKMLTNDAISNILDTVLEPQFVKKDYGTGATATSNALYSFLLARADQSVGAAGATGTSGGTAVSNSSTSASPQDTEISIGKGLMLYALLFGPLILFGYGLSRRNKYIEMYGLPFNPYSPRNVRRYGNWYGQADYGYGRRWHRRYYHHHHHRNTPTNNSQSSFWGNSGGGGSTNGGGAGRYSSSNENRGGGGSSSGGGAGRHSSSSSSSSSYSSNDGGSSGGGGSSSGGSSGGGGSASSGGGAGRH
jgi:uncharacterized protein